MDTITWGIFFSLSFYLLLSLIDQKAALFFAAGPIGPTAEIIGSPPIRKIDDGY